MEDGAEGGGEEPDGTSLDEDGDPRRSGEDQVPQVRRRQVHLDREQA